MQIQYIREERDCGITGPKYNSVGSGQGAAFFAANMCSGRARALPLVGAPRPNATFLTSPYTIVSSAPPDPFRPSSTKAIHLDEFRTPS